jgi:putative glutamine amidotransferase
MKLVAVTQRVSLAPSHAERRDCLDQAWPAFLGACGLLCVPLPNDAAVALALCDTLPISGLVLTGGNDLAAVGGDAPERDATELAVLEATLARGLPVLGVCRGMQLIQHRASVPLRRVEGHVTARQDILIDGEPAETNSYHNFGATESRPPLETWAVAADGVVKAVRDRERALTGIMWHPERQSPFSPRDIALVRRMFGVV